MGKKDILIRLAARNLALEMALLVIQVLQLEVQPVDLLARLGGLGLGVAGGQAGAAVQAAQVGDVCEELLLLLGDLGLGLGGGAAVAGAVGELEEGVGLVAGLVGDLEDGGEGGLRDDFLDGHGWWVCVLCREAWGVGRRGGLVGWLVNSTDLMGESSD